jgi:hypothetical protein
MARKIKELNAAANVKDRQLGMISSQARVLTGLMMVKENRNLVEQLGVSSLISKMDIEELKGYVEQATVEGKFQMDRFAEVLKAVEGPQTGWEDEEDSEVMEIVAAMQEARDAEEEEDLAVEMGLDKVDETLTEEKEDRAEEEEV